MQLSEAKLNGYLVKPTDQYGLSYYQKPSSIRPGFSGLVQDMNLKDSFFLLSAVVGGMMGLAYLYKTIGKRK